MSRTYVINGKSFNFPETRDVDWGDAVTNWASAVTSDMLSLAGGLFSISNEIDFGATAGLKSLYFKSRATYPSTSGQVRLGNNESIGWRNSGNTDNKYLKVNTSDWIQYQGVDLVDLSTSQTLTNKSISGATGVFNTIVTKYLKPEDNSSYIGSLDNTFYNGYFSYINVNTDILSPSGTFETIQASSGELKLNSYVFPSIDQVWQLGRPDLQWAQIYSYSINDPWFPVNDISVRNIGYPEIVGLPNGCRAMIYSNTLNGITGVFTGGIQSPNFVGSTGMFDGGITTPIIYTDYIDSYSNPSAATDIIIKKNLLPDGDNLYNLGDNINKWGSVNTYLIDVASILCQTLDFSSLSGVTGVFSGGVQTPRIIGHTGIFTDLRTGNFNFTGLAGVTGMFVGGVDSVGGLIQNLKVGNTLEVGNNATFRPTTDANVDFGSAGKRWKDGYFSGNVTVDGNFHVSGTLTYIDTETLLVQDPDFQINIGGDYTTAQNAGMVVSAGSTSINVGKIAYDSTLASNWKCGSYTGMKEIITTSDIQSLTNKTTVQGVTGLFNGGLYSPEIVTDYLKTSTSPSSSSTIQIQANLLPYPANTFNNGSTGLPWKNGVINNVFSDVIKVSTSITAPTILGNTGIFHQVGVTGLLGHTAQLITLNTANINCTGINAYTGVFQQLRGTNTNGTTAIFSAIGCTGLLGITGMFKGMRSDEITGVTGLIGNIGCTGIKGYTGTFKQVGAELGNFTGLNGMTGMFNWLNSGIIVGTTGLWVGSGASGIKANFYANNSSANKPYIRHDITNWKFCDTGSAPEYFLKDMIPQVHNLSGATGLTVTEGIHNIYCNMGSAFTLTLPAAASNVSLLNVYKTDTSFNTLTISRAGSDTIEGMTTRTISIPNGAVRLLSDQTSVWRVL